MHNLGTVIWFEFIRTLKKKSFWISALAFPVLMGLIFAVVYFSSDSAEKASQRAAQQKFTIALTDQSGLLLADVISSAQAQPIGDKQQGIDLVKDGQIEAYFFYPVDPVEQPIEIYAKDVGLIDNQRYSTVAQQLLTASVATSIHSPTKVAIIQDQTSTNVTTFKDGQEQPGFERVIAPGSLLLLFYLVIALLANRMLASTTEEKENRVIEMILTTVQAKTLVLGKILAMVLIGAVQIAVIVIPALAISYFFGQQLNLPNVDLSALTISTQQVVVGSLAFILGFFLMTGCLVAIGAAVPTAKEANNFFGIVVLSMLIPLYALMAIISDPDQPLVQIMTYFPLTSPVTLMLRNAVNNIPLWQAAISLTILAVSALASLFIAARTFGYGTLEYNRKLSFKEIFR